MADGGIGKAKITTVFDPAQTAKAADQAITPAIDQAAKKGAQLLAGAFAGKALLNVGVQGLDELKEAEKVAAQTAATIKATGGVAGVSAEQVDELAGSLSKLSGVDDEAIASGENLLLTFKNVRNEAGAGNDIFNQATKAALDLSVAFGQDMSASAIQLGKALDNPIQGVTALQRVGVSFTAAQKEQIAALVQSGEVMQAQKIILRELESQVGGSAKAFGETLPGQIAKAEVAMDNAKGAMVAGLAPALEIVASGAESAAEFIADLPGPLRTVASVTLATATAIVGIAQPLSGMIVPMKQLAAAREANAIAAGNVAAAEAAAGASGVAAAAGLGAVATAEGAVATNSAAAVAGLYATDSAAKQLLVTLGPYAAAVAVVGAALVAADAFEEPFVDAQAALDALNASVGKLGDSFADLTTSTSADLKSFLDDLVTGGEGGADFAEALNTLGVTTQEFAGRAAKGRQSLEQWLIPLAKAKGISLDDKVALDALVTSLDEQATATINAAQASGEFTEAQVTAARQQTANTDGTNNDIAALNLLGTTAEATATAITTAAGSLTLPFDLAKGSTEHLNTALNDLNKQKALEGLTEQADELERALDEAASAALALAPADIRARRGAIAQGDAKQGVADAQQKLKDAQAAGDATAIAKARTNLDRANLDLEQSTLDLAEAQTELQVETLKANGVTDDQIDKLGISRTNLDFFAQGLTGVAHDALVGYVKDLDDAIAKQAEMNQALAAAEQAAHILDPSAPDSGFKENLRGTNGNRAFASGGQVDPFELFRGAEQGFEILASDGLFRAPAGGGQVLNHADSVRALQSIGGKKQVNQNVVINAADIGGGIDLAMRKLAWQASVGVGV